MNANMYAGLRSPTSATDDGSAQIKNFKLGTFVSCTSSVKRLRVVSYFVLIICSLSNATMHEISPSRFDKVQLHNNHNPNCTLHKQNKILCENWQIRLL